VRYDRVESRFIPFRRDEDGLFVLRAQGAGVRNISDSQSGRKTKKPRPARRGSLKKDGMKKLLSIHLCREIEGEKKPAGWRSLDGRRPFLPLTGSV